MKEIHLRTPTKCQNGHFRWYFYTARYGQTFDNRWGEKHKLCNCPTGSNMYLSWNNCGEDQLFTGLNDRKGNPIYEGDVVRSMSHNPMDYVVEFTENAFCTTHPKIDDYPINLLHFYPLPGCQITVVGNIYETPELVKL